MLLCPYTYRLYVAFESDSFTTFHNSPHQQQSKPTSSSTISINYDNSRNLLNQFNLTKNKVKLMRTRIPVHTRTFIFSSSLFFKFFFVSSTLMFMSYHHFTFSHRARLPSTPTLAHTFLFIQTWNCVVSLIPVRVAGHEPVVLCTVHS